MEFFAGIAIAAAVLLLAALVGLDKDRAFYPTVMIVIASYYSLFAAMGGSVQALIVETAAMLVFLAIAIFGFKRNLWVVVAALFSHGVFDYFHGHLIDNAGVPSWWPMFCLAYDVVAAACLAWLLRRSKISAAKFEAGRLQ